MQKVSVIDSDTSLKDPNVYYVGSVMYVFGYMQEQLNEQANNLDLEEIYSLSKLIANRWVENKDIQCFEEESYISVYAERKWNELYGNVVKD